MKQAYIFQYEDSVSFSAKKETVTAIFLSQVDALNQNDLAQEINEFFRQHSISEKLVVLLPSYISEELLKMFLDEEQRKITFQRVPGRTTDFFDRCLLLLKYDHEGNYSIIAGNLPNESKMFLHHMMRNGATKIFKDNGGLVESTPDHHFVFPSKKHCAKFIRTGNVLINSSEIFFLALQVLPFIHGKKLIYCDTSSINVIAYAAFELIHRFKIAFTCPAVYSFKSYEVFESNESRFSEDAVILISSSTSGNIIDRLLKENLAIREQIKVIYFLGPEEKYNKHALNIICNLTCDESKFKEGVVPFKTYESAENCELCKEHSHPIYIRSDVFLTVQPKVERILIGVDQAPKQLSKFVERYLGKQKDKVIFKNYYKENVADADYEIFIDTTTLFNSCGSENFIHFNESLVRLINKHIPANISCLIYLEDEGSKLLAELIKSHIPASVPVDLIKLEEGFESRLKEDYKTAVIVASTTVMGKGFLHISRSLRRFKNLSLIYFVGILRTIHEDYSKTLKANLGKGKNESDDRPLISVEKIFCSAEKTNTIWHLEKQLLEEMIADTDEDSELYAFIDQRLTILRRNKETIGLSDDVFLPKYDGGSLVLRKNFAFFDFDYEESEISQSELYFTISSIIARLANLKITEKYSLRQSNYVRNVLCPGNFQRYNDGIIQASLLRTGKPEYFAYDLQDDLSLEIKVFILSMIEKYNSEHGEALMEFLLAIGLRRLRLKKNDLSELLQQASKCPDKIISQFSTLIIKYLNSDSK